MAPKDTVWPLESHTIGKHRVLRSYLNAWLPIMGFSNDRIIFIDCFAGPGVYEGGEEGSPVIALRSLSEHSAKDRFRAEVIYLFIDNDKRRVAKLTEVIAPLVDALPEACKVYVEHGDCVEVLGKLLDDLDEKEQRLAPAFVMLDPFGVAYTPMSMVGRLLGKPKVEIYLSFMYEAINRHL